MKNVFSNISRVDEKTALSKHPGESKSKKSSGCFRLDEDYLQDLIFDSLHNMPSSSGVSKERQPSKSKSKVKRTVSEKPSGRPVQHRLPARRVTTESERDRLPRRGLLLSTKKTTSSMRNLGSTQETESTSRRRLLSTRKERNLMQNPEAVATNSEKEPTPRRGLGLTKTKAASMKNLFTPPEVVTTRRKQPSSNNNGSKSNKKRDHSNHTKSMRPQSIISMLESLAAEDDAKAGAFMAHLKDGHSPRVRSSKPAIKRSHASFAA